VREGEDAATLFWPAGVAPAVEARFPGSLQANPSHEGFVPNPSLRSIGHRQRLDGYERVHACHQSRPGGIAASPPILNLLDGFHLVSAASSVPLPLSAQRLLAFVALHDRPLQRSYVAGSLWLDSPEERAYASLRSALWRLHRCGLPLVQSSGPQLWLDERIVVDLREAEALAHRALDGTCAEPFDVAASALTSDLLPDWYDDWILLERERYRQLRLRALDTLCDRLVQAGRLNAALEVGLAAVAGEPLRESSHRAVIRVHLADGNVAEAIRQYRLCRRLLHGHLGLEPSDQMAELMRGTHVLDRLGDAEDQFALVNLHPG
jgi:DNA-binding SARP family transcriptional activator